MKISIIGTGYVGLCTGAGFASLGHEVICVDISQEKVDMINSGKPPIYEKGLEEMLKQCIKNKTIKATTDLGYAVLNSQVSFIAVGTPSEKDGSIDLNYIKQVSADIGKAIKKKNGHIIVVKSTVLPETTGSVVIPLLEKNSAKRAGSDFGVCMNPEFLREGMALEDFLHPDRIVIGEYDKESGDVLEKLYKDFKAPILRSDLKTAEMIKYASNSFLATKVSFINEIGNICKRLGIDVYDVAKGMAYDKRISPLFLQAGCGFGGSCFKKDLMALISKAVELNYEARILNSAIETNSLQPMKIIELLEKRLKDLKNKNIAVLGLAFKPETDDIRDTPAIDIIRALLEKGAVINAYDPKAEENMRKIFPDINYCEDAGKALKDSDACLILTEWQEFKNLSDKDFDAMREKIVIEGRKVLNPDMVTDFEGICW